MITVSVDEPRCLAYPLDVDPGREKRDAAVVGEGGEEGAGVQKEGIPYPLHRVALPSMSCFQVLIPQNFVHISVLTSTKHKKT